MTQTADIINFERPVVKADIENGFTRIANELTEALMNNPAKLCGREFQIVHAIIHKTFRFHKKSDWINNAQISEMTGIAQSKISELKKSLINKNVLVVEGRNISINTTVSEWSTYPNKGKGKVTQKRVSTYPKTGNELPKNGYQITQKRVTHKKDYLTKDNNTKENSFFPATQPTKKVKVDVQSEVLNLDLPNFIGFELWSELVAHRKEIKKPFTVRAAKMQLNQLIKWHTKGHDIEEIIQTSISNGYQGLFEPKGAGNGRSFQSTQERIREDNLRVMSDWASKE